MKVSSYFQTTCISLALFLLLTISVLSDSGVTHWLDGQLMAAMGQLVHPIFTQMFIFLTTIGSPVVISMIVVLLLLLARQFSIKTRISLGLFYFGTSALGLLLKHVFLRARPNHQLLADTGYSYPSGHTLCISLFFLVVVFLLQSWDKKWAKGATLIILGIFCLGVIFSRIYLRDHFPTDIIASILISTAAYSLFRGLHSHFSNTPTQSVLI